MPIPIEQIINLLHQCSFGTLATHSLHVPGYPFATVLPFVPDERHCPVFLMSSLAEHTKNIGANARASLLVFDPLNANVLTSARLTLVGEVRPVDASDALVARYCRYHPDAENYLTLGGFTFFRLEPTTIRAISGFGTMGWIDAEALLTAAALPAEQEEQALVDAIQGQIATRVLGIDRYGVDVAIEHRRERYRFPDPPLDEDEVAEAVRRMLSNA